MEISLGRLMKNKWTLRLLSLVGGLILWTVGSISTRGTFLPFPLEVATAFVNLAVDGPMLPRLLESLRHMFVGFGLGAVAGVLFGLVMGRSTIAEYTLDPWVNAIYSVPTAAYFPLILLIFGIAFETKVVLVFLFVVFPVLVNTLTGAKNVERPLIEAGLSFGASKRELWTKIILPAITPYIMAGLRLGMGLAVIGMVLVEMWIISGTGLLLIYYARYFQMDKAIAVVLEIMIVGILLTESVKYVERRLTWWKKG